MGKSANLEQRLRKLAEEDPIYALLNQIDSAINKKDLKLTDHLLSQVKINPIPKFDMSTHPPKLYWHDDESLIDFHDHLKTKRLKLGRAKNQNAQLEHQAISSAERKRCGQLGLCPLCNNNLDSILLGETEIQYCDSCQDITTLEDNIEKIRNNLIRKEELKFN